MASGRIAVAMSGGVDSSVSAALLVEQGYEVFGLMMRLWSENGQASKRDNRCCTRDQMIDAALVAKRLGIAFEVVDVRETFKREIVDFFIDGYSQGITPNPCLACNRQIRFTFLLNEALQRGASHLATGHYARITQDDDGKFELRRGCDESKDQSYVLSVLTQHQLSHAMFPVGEYGKPEVRELARRFGLRVAGKSDSQDLCFIADGNYRRFLSKHMGPAAARGAIQSSNGTVLGEHDGLPNYTIGQRKGLGLTSPQPLYVIAKNIEANILVVGAKEELGQCTFGATEMNWISGCVPEAPFRAQVKIRYRSAAASALITPAAGSRVEICPDSPLPEVTPGQGAVLYDDDRVIGCGIISLNQ